MNKISFYIFMQIFKACILVFFIFISISWLLQITRLFTLTNLIQVDIITILLLSFYLIPNLITIILPFVIIFGIILCFLKLNRDKELIAIYSLGLSTTTIKVPLLLFSLITSIFFIILNFYISPNIYEKYKYKEFQLRNTINFEKMMLSNFLEINNDTIIDFKKDENNFNEIFISFKDKENKDNLIFATNGDISNDKFNYIFKLSDGFKLSININEIEKLEFENYLLKININNTQIYENFDRNTFNIIEDWKSKNYLNISYKINDIIFLIIIIFIYYNYNIINNKFAVINNVIFITISTIILICNQLMKSAEIYLSLYLMSSIVIILLTFSIIFILKIKDV